MTGNEIAHRDEQQAVATTQQAAAPAPTAGSTALMQWAQEADLAYQMAQKLAATSFVPQSLRGKPGDITAAILAGAELGLKPMATLKSIDVIQGTPALRAHAMRAVVQKQGHEIELVESTPEKCVMRGRRKGSDTWQTVEWTLERAAQLGLVNKPEWKKQPQTMLVARATGELCRLIASDALHGMPYVSEELEGTTTGEVLPPKKAPLSVAVLTAPAAEPAADEPAYSVTRDDQPEAGAWDQDAIDDSVDWQPENEQ
ncbi:hypothetical protein [Streptomyces sp. WAC08401]|uniref:hypothetical protein n=1 Tax=Streptomyces sp. WAC08401 TaxID=2487413 RepID=UPI000FAD00B1|nr:hypothetical protein [Streptomyces sp. WAC08401]RSS11365.1 hypothetical protein EF915_24770 [Streptomyces sp. WAC08401]